MAKKKSSKKKSSDTGKSKKLGGKTEAEWQEIFEEETGKNAVWRGKVTKNYECWLDEKLEACEDENDSGKKSDSKKEEKKPVKGTKTKKKPPEKGKSSKKTEKKTKKTDNKDEDDESDDEVDRVESFRKAGAIAKKVKEFIKPKIKVGAKVIDLVEAAETKIKELGGKPGFPVNISINHVAAHDTPAPGDKRVIKEGDVVKFDMGVHTGDGYPVDTAFTINFNDSPDVENLAKAAEEAVDVAIKLIKPGMKTNHLGGKIEETVKKYGFRPIRDLSGHKIDHWNLHAGKEIPCIKIPPGTGDTIEEGEVFAVEVFSSTGTGNIHQQSNAQIYSLTGEYIQLRNKKAKKVLSHIIGEYKTLPFSKWQIFHEFPKQMFGLVLITKSDGVIEHNILSEKKGRGIYVAQHEETVLVTEDGCEILT